MKKYTITLTEEQMRLIAEGMEDYHRFLAGECRMMNATQYVRPAQEMHYLRDELEMIAHDRMSHGLRKNSSYDWAGTHCPNDHQRKAIAMSYMIYREILHYFAMQRPKEIWNCLQDPTLTCEEQGPLIKIQDITDK